MNNIRAIEKLNQRELEAGIPLSASWHTDWSDTAYVYIGGLPYELSEGDIITIFSQFGEPVHLNLIRDKDTGKSKGFAFLKYEDQRSTNLAVDNLGGATILGRIIRVDHTRYKPKEGELGELVAQGSGPSEQDDDDDEESEHNSKRRKGKEREETPTRKMLPEEIELQKLIRDHNEDDPMKEYLVRQKKEEVELALQKLKREKKRPSRHRRDGDSKRDHRHSHRHRSRSKEGSRRHRSRSKERTQRERASEEPRNSREKDRGSRRETDRDKDSGRDKDKVRDREGNSRLERERGRDRRHGDSGHSSRREGHRHDD
ncbi:hypothetical protein C7212DRAFT_299697 [Tuber magnatum]|uniref:RRM domain-containing protein n=1 Tax=Tuber magnatum TaxID=42249 RepID=A0A317SK40_9PEZI|nr:hypothetical protein C7212DRAFT_299697 [Tuber magnatum]